jgi:hypothetical protein
MSGGFNAKVVMPDAYKTQTESGGFQKPFFMGAAQTPVALGLSPHTYSGAGVAKKPAMAIDTHHKVHLPLR